MRKLQDIILRIDEIREALSKRYGEKDVILPIDAFWEKTRRSLLLLDLVESSKSPKELKIEARKNFIINCVTALENFLKDTIFGLTEIGNLSAREILKEEKISLYDAYKLFVDRKVSLGELIVVRFSLNNLEQIDYLMSTLIGSKFLDEVGEFEVKDEDNNLKFTLNNRFPEWRNRLSELFRLRHLYVHQVSFKDRLGLERIQKILETLSVFVEATEQYLFEFIPMDR